MKSTKIKCLYLPIFWNLLQTKKRKNVVEIAFERFIVVHDVHLNGLDSLVVESVFGEVYHISGLVANDEFVEVG